MQIHERFLIVVGMAALWTGAAAAQVCTGDASFAGGASRVSASLGVGSGYKAISGSFDVGSDRGPFATLGVGRTEYDDLDDAAVQYGVGVGYSIYFTPSKKAAICPMVGVFYDNGPSIPTTTGDIKSNGHAYSVGLGVGGIAASTATVDFVPNAAVGYSAARFNYRLNGEKIFETQSHTELGLGVGLVVNHTVTIQPSLSIPFGLKNGKTSFDLSFGINF